MKQSLCVLFCMTILFACQEPAADNTAAPAPLTKEEVTAFIDLYDSAWNSKQVSIIDSLFGKEYIYFNSLGSTSPRGKSLEMLAAEHYKVLKADRSELDILIDGNTAIVSSRWRGDGLWQGQPFHDNQRCGLVIQKQNGQLKLLTEHCVEIKGDSTQPAE